MPRHPLLLLQMRPTPLRRWCKDEGDVALPRRRLLFVRLEIALPARGGTPPMQSASCSCCPKSVSAKKKTKQKKNEKKSKQGKTSRECSYVCPEPVLAK
jgi:hypothetical protein